MNLVAAIYRKEMTDTLRDRKTLVFMLLVPMAFIPLLMFGMVRFLMAFEQAERTRPVTIVADDASREAYEALVHRWFGATELGRDIARLDAPWMQLLVRRGERAPGSPPAGASRDPALFADWTREFATVMREGLHDLEWSDAELPQPDALPEALRSDLLDFHEYAIKGLGLVEFRAPESLERIPDSFDLSRIPGHLHSVPGIARIARAIDRGEVNGVLEIAPDWRERLAAGEQVVWTLYHDSTVDSSREARRRVERTLSAAGGEIARVRLENLGVGTEYGRPLAPEPGTDLATPARVTLGVVAGILPAFVLIFAFLGGFYPAIDLGAGEKERQTLETLLLSPATRTEIALGKYLVILTTSLVAALLGVTSMALSFRFLVPGPILEMLQIRIDPLHGFLAALTMLPAAATFAALLLAVSIYARSFKEAQNYIAPLQFLLVLPALAPQLPGVETNLGLALVPLVNVALLASDFLQGRIEWTHYAATMVSCLAAAALCLALAVRQFSRESVLFRS